MNPADKFMIFFCLLDLFYDNPLDFGPIINPQFFFLYMGYFDSVRCLIIFQIKNLTTHHFQSFISTSKPKFPYLRPRPDANLQSHGVDIFLTRSLLGEQSSRENTICIPTCCVPRFFLHTQHFCPERYLELTI